MIRVLLVEDDAMIREMTRIFLESQKRFEVVCAASGEEALAHAKDPFDVILLDILLPDTNGMQLCQTLRSGHHCPIIFTSCLDDVDTIVHALELGGDDFLTKPYDNKVLVARILANVRRPGFPAGCRQPQCALPGRGHPSGRYGIPHPQPVRAQPQHLFYGQ